MASASWLSHRPLGAKHVSSFAATSLCSRVLDVILIFFYTACQKTCEVLHCIPEY